MIKSLRLENFQSHKDSTFNFDKGLNVLCGSSNQGKTSCARALSLVLYNTFDRSWPRIGSSFCVVTLTMDSGAVVIRKKGEKINQYVLQIPNQAEQIFSNFGLDVPEAVSRVLRIGKIDLGKDDPLILNYASQMEPLFLFGKSGSAKANVLGHLSNAHFLDFALRSLSTEKKQINVEKNLKTQELGLLKEQFTALESVKQFKIKLDELEEKNAVLETSRQRIEALKSLFLRTQDWKRRYTLELDKESILAKAKAVELESVTASVQRLKELKVLLSQQQSLSTKIKILNDAKNQFEIDLEKETQTYLTTLHVNKVCPTCFNILDNQKLDEIKNNLTGKEKCHI